MSFFFLSVQLRISEEDHLARSLATYLFLLHFRFSLIYKTAKFDLFPLYNNRKNNRN